MGDKLFKIFELYNIKNCSSMESYKRTFHDDPAPVRDRFKFDAGYSYSAVSEKKQQRTFKHYPFVVEWQLNNADPESKSNA